jgi:hypothetical protein
MPSVVSPAQVQTANQQNMYVPIDGNTAVLPPILETPSINGSNINGLGAPFLISTSVIVNGNAPYTSTLRALSLNGPMYINYDLNPSNPYVPSLDVSGNTVVLGSTIATTLLIAQDTFKLPISYVDFAGTYNLGKTYCMDWGNLRFVWGERDNVDDNGTGNSVLQFNSIPPNTFSNLPRQNTTGLFDTLNSPANVVSIGCMNNYVSDGTSYQFFYGMLTMPNGVNVPAFSAGNVVPWIGNDGYNISYLVVGPLKSV